MRAGKEHKIAFVFETAKTDGAAVKNFNLLPQGKSELWFNICLRVRHVIWSLITLRSVCCLCFQILGVVFNIVNKTASIFKILLSECTLDNFIFITKFACHSVLTVFLHDVFICRESIFVWFRFRHCWEKIWPTLSLAWGFWSAKIACLCCRIWGQSNSCNRQAGFVLKTGILTRNRQVFSFYFLGGKFRVLVHQCRWHKIFSSQETRGNITPPEREAHMVERRSLNTNVRATTQWRTSPLSPQKSRESPKR